MIHYLGPSFGGNGPVTNVLPPATPGTMPSGVPNIASTPPPVPSNPPLPKHPAIAPPQTHPAAHVLSAIVNHIRQNGGAPSQAEVHPEYGTTTQQDGSILLHLKNHDGSLGPVVKVIPPIKRSTDSGPKMA